MELTRRQSLESFSGSEATLQTFRSGYEAEAVRSHRVEFAVGLNRDD